MWNNKLKAITFSFDDGVINDIKLLEVLDKYNLKGTFNINSGKDNVKWVLSFPDGPLDHITFPLNKIKEIYRNHEVAAHTLTHPFLPQVSDEEVIHQVKDDAINLEKLVGYPIKGFAYPGGGINHDARVTELIRKNTNIKYARTIESSHSFDLQDDLLVFNPTVYWLEPCFEEIIDKFLALKTDKPQLLYIWGHSYEADAFKLWEKFDAIFKKLANHDDIFYGTNSECLLDK